VGGVRKSNDETKTVNEEEGRDLAKKTDQKRKGPRGKRESPGKWREPGKKTKKTK